MYHHFHPPGKSKIWSIDFAVGIQCHKYVQRISDYDGTVFIKHQMRPRNEFEHIKMVPEGRGIFTSYIFFTKELNNILL